MTRGNEPHEPSSESPEPQSLSARVEAARNGDIPLYNLTLDEFAAFNAAVDEAIARRLATADWQGMLSLRGFYSVTLDDGQIVVRPPDGSVPRTRPNPNSNSEPQEQTDKDV